MNYYFTLLLILSTPCLTFAQRSNGVEYCPPDAIHFFIPDPVIPCDLFSLCSKYQNDPVTLTITDDFASSFGSSLVDKVIQINGTFTIDNQFELRDCIIKMAPDAIINVITTAIFTIDNCRIFCCGAMWTGIQVVSGGRIIIIKGTAIQDAWTAVDVTDPGVCIIRNSFFNKNNICIRIRDNEGFCKFGIVGNEFNCNFNLNEFSPQTPVMSAYCGILIENSKNVKIGILGQDINRFYNHYVDVISDNSQVCIKQSQFLRGGGWYINNNLTGTNVHALNHSDVCIHGLGHEENDEITFEKAPIANIRGNNSTIRCYNSIFRNTERFAILIENTGEHYFRIENNRFEAVNQTGIFATRNIIRVDRGTVDLDFIRYNYFNSGYPMNSNGGGGSIIRVSDNASAPSYLDVYSNEIWTNGSTAITMNAGNTIRNHIQSNKLFSNANAGFGIIFNSGIGGASINEINRITGNTIDDGNFTVGVGILGAASQRAEICGNHLFNSGTGIRLTANCQNAIVGGNNFNNNNIGLDLEGNGINLGIGTNDHRTNTWNGTFGTVAARHTGTDFIFSPFEYNSSIECGNEAYLPRSNGIASVFPSSNWFLPDLGCPNPCGILTLLGGGGTGDILYDAILQNTYSNTGQSDATVWDTKYALYRDMAHGINTYSVAYMWGNEGEYNLLTLVEDKIKEAHALSNSTRTHLLDLHNTVAILMETSSELQSQYVLNPATPELEATITSVFNQLHTANADLAYWRAVAKGERMTKLNEANNLNQQITSGNIFKNNMKAVNEIRLHYLQGGQFTNTMLQTLESLAGECFEAAGPAIYFAYSLLPDCRKPSTFPADCIRGRNSEDAEITANNQEEQRKELKIYPNPAIEALTVSNLEYHPDIQEGAIFNVFGQRVIQFINLQTGKAIDISGLAAGTYFLKLSKGTGVIKVFPFIKTAN